MSGAQADLALVWYLLLALVLALTLLLDGLDLGVGVLSLFLRREEERGLMMASVAGVWHANQTWLVVLGALLFGAFPLAYGLVLSALYLPVALMLLGFILRGVSLEYYSHAADPRPWGLAFGLGSLLATLAQGLGLGALLSGLPLVAGRYSGGAWGWLSPFSFAAALGLLGCFVLMGAGWLVLKTNGELQDKARRAARATSFFLLLAAPALILWSCRLHPFLSARWLAWPGMLGQLPAPVPGRPLLPRPGGQPGPGLGRGLLLVRPAYEPAAPGRPGRQHLPGGGAAGPHRAPGGGPGHQPQVHAHGCVRGAAPDAGLQRLSILGVPGEGGAGARLRVGRDWSFRNPQPPRAATAARARPCSQAGKMPSQSRPTAIIPRASTSAGPAACFSLSKPAPSGGSCKYMAATTLK